MEKNLQSAIIARLNQANGRLKAGKIGVRIEVKGDRLYLRGTFPPKPGAKKDYPHQQRISLAIHANIDGIKLAEAEARRVGLSLDSKTFSWAPYLKNKPPLDTPKDKSISQWIDEFKSHYFARRAKTPATLSTFNNYLSSFRKIPVDKPLSADSLIEAALKTPADSGARRNTVRHLMVLAKFAGIECDLSEYIGNYSIKKINPRSLPSDDLIISVGKSLSGPAAWCFWMMAIYGLRNHELFHLDLSDIDRSGEISVGESTKTKDRIIFPCPKKWLEFWDLKNQDLPVFPKPIATYPNEYLGNKIRKLFSDAKVPFSPYNLRHAWARRSFEHRWPPEMAAAMMGHSLDVHIRIYHAWMAAASFREVYQKIELE